MKIDPRNRKMLMTIRAALIMAAKAIEEYCREEGSEVVSTANSNMAGVVANAEN